MSLAENVVNATYFKAHCLELMERVRSQREAIVITKRGKQVAKVVPADGEATAAFGCMKGTAEAKGDLFATGESWDAIATLEIPQDILDSARVSLGDLKTELAVFLYSQGRLSVGKARELAAEHSAAGHPDRAIT